LTITRPAALMAVGKGSGMTAKEWVSLAIRVIGFWLAVQGLIYLLASRPFLNKEPGLSAGTALLALWPGRIVMIVMGGWMLFRTDGIVRVCGVNSRRQE
jgi:hypothetical protein